MHMPSLEWSLLVHLNQKEDFLKVLFPKMVRINKKSIGTKYGSCTASLTTVTQGVKNSVPVSESMNYSIVAVRQLNAK